MNASVSGMAPRLVIRKYLGKVWKRIQTSGAVKAWQERVSAAALHRRRSGSQRVLRGYQASRRGNTSTIPSIAR